MYKNPDDKTAKLAAEYGVEINDAALNSIKISSINLIVLRRFGFGGQLLAYCLRQTFQAGLKIEQLKKEYTVDLLPC